MKMDKPVLEALQQIEDLLDLIEDDVTEEAKLRGADFFESVIDSAKAMSDTIQRTGKVSVHQRQALDNWEHGVRRWIR